MSKSYNKTKSLKLLINQTKKNKLLVNSYVKKMFNFYKPILQLLEKKPHIAQIFSIKKNSTMRNFLTYIYAQFIEVNKVINTLNIIKSRTETSNVTTKISNVIKEHLSKSIYIDSSIITYISNNLNNCKIISYENIIHNKKFVLDFIVYDKININNLDNIVKNMLIFLQILIKISENSNNEINECSKDGISITFFLTPFLKKLNISKTESEAKEILGAKNVNSGFNYTCLNSGLIFIYRKEDFFKVFVHESVHGYGIDRALHFNFAKNEHYKKFINFFAFANKPITDVGINESVTEFWTSLLYLCINSYQDSKNLSSFIYNFERLYKFELVHALYQISKILHYNNLTYNSFINNSNSNYRENSHIFSYFIVKTMMLLNHEHMLNSQLFDLNDLNNLNNLQLIKTNVLSITNNNINIKLKSDAISINKLFTNLYDYARDPYFVKIMNIIELEYMKHYNKYMRTYGNVKTHKQTKNNNNNKNKNKNLTMRKITTRKHQSKTNNTLHMLTNLKMMIYDYNI
jgi:hypothetical protein